MSDFFFFYIFESFNIYCTICFSSAHLLGTGHIHPWKHIRRRNDMNNNIITTKSLLFLFSFACLLYANGGGGWLYYYYSSLIWLKSVLIFWSQNPTNPNHSKKKTTKNPNDERTMSGKKRRQNGIARFHFQFHELKNSFSFSSFLSIQFE